VLFHSLEERIRVDKLVEMELADALGHLEAGLVVQRLLVQSIVGVANLVHVAHELVVSRSHEAAEVVVFNFVGLPLDVVGVGL